MLCVCRSGWWQRHLACTIMLCVCRSGWWQRHLACTNHLACTIMLCVCRSGWWQRHLACTIMLCVCRSGWRQRHLACTIMLCVCRSGWWRHLACTIMLCVCRSGWWQVGPGGFRIHAVRVWGGCPAFQHCHHSTWGDQLCYQQQGGTGTGQFALSSSLGVGGGGVNNSMLLASDWIASCQFLWSWPIFKVW